jgi:hypothetical protein
MKTFAFSQARVSPDGELCLRVDNLPMARQLVLEMNGKPYTAEIKEYRQKRSLDANAYAWKLMDELAQAIRSTKEEVYRRAIQEVGIFRDFHLKENEVQPFCRLWERQGTAWMTERLDYQQDGNNAVIRAYYGSSVYNTRQMARLIDCIVEDCKAVGVETLPPEKLEALKKDWKHEK